MVRSGATDQTCCRFPLLNPLPEVIAGFVPRTALSVFGAMADRARLIAGQHAKQPGSVRAFVLQRGMLHPGCRDAPMLQSRRGNTRIVRLMDAARPCSDSLLVRLAWDYRRRGSGREVRRPLPDSSAQR